MIRVEAENAGREKIVRYYHMDQKTGFGGGPFLAHIGLLDAIRIDRVDVAWPATHCTAPYHADLARVNVLDEAPCLAAPSGTAVP